MASLDVGELKMTIMADGSAAIEELNRVRQAAGEAAEGIEAGFDGAGDDLEGVSNAAKGAGDGMKKAGDEGEKAGKKAAKSFKELGDQMTKVGSACTKFLTLPIVGALTAAVSGASDLTETVGKTEVVFDRMSGKVMKWSEDSVRTMGLAQGTALEFASTYGDMATGMGLSIEQATTMSMNLTQLAADMASFKNIRTDVAAQKLNAVFTGETEGLKSLGIVMTQANLQAFALSQGIDKNVSAMSQQELVMLRYQYVMSVTANAQGDFVRTGDSLANQSRKLGETVKQTGESFGAILTPMVTGAVSGLQQFVQSIAELDDGAKRMILSFAMAAAAVGPVLLVGGKLLSLIASAKALLASLSLNPVIIALTALAALGVAFAAANAALNKADEQAIRASDSYQKLKAAVEGGVEGEVKVDDSQLRDLDGRPYTVTIDGDPQAALDRAKKLVEDLKSDAHKGMLTIDGNPELAEQKLAEIEQHVQNAENAILNIDANPQAAKDAVEELEGDIAILRSFVVVTEDPVARRGIEERIAQLEGRIREIRGKVHLEFEDDGSDAAEHYREELEKLPKDETFRGIGKFVFDEKSKEDLKEYNEAMALAVGTTGDFKDLNNQMDAIVDKDTANRIAQVGAQAAKDAQTLTAAYKTGAMSEEDYVAGLHKIADAKDAEVKRIQAEGEAQKEFNKTFANGTASDDVGAWRTIMERQYDQGQYSKEDIIGIGNQSLALMNDVTPEQRAGMGTEGALALSGLHEQSIEQYEGMKNAVDAYTESIGKAEKAEGRAAQSNELAEAYGQAAEGIEYYGEMVEGGIDRQLAFDTAMEQMKADGADTTAINAMSAALHDETGALVDADAAAIAHAGALDLQGEAEKTAAQQSEEAAKLRQTAAEDLQTALHDIADTHLDSAATGEALIQIDETGVDISGAERALLTGIPDAVDKAVAAADSAVANGTDPMQALSEVMSASAPLVENAATTTVSTAASSAAQLATSGGRSIGANLASGISAGVMAAAGMIASAAANAVRRAIAAAKAAANIQSPSHVMRDEVGVQLMRGASVGIEREAPNTARVMKRATEGLIAGASTAVRDRGLTLPAFPAPADIDYGAMGDAMRGAVKGLRFAFAVDGREMAMAQRDNNSSQLAFRASQVNHGYGGHA